MRSKRIFGITACIALALIAIATAASALTITGDSLVTVPSSGVSNIQYTVYGTGFNVGAQVWVKSPLGVTYQVQEVAWAIAGTSVRGYLTIPASAAPGSYTTYVRNAGSSVSWYRPGMFTKLGSQADLATWTFNPRTGMQPRTFTVQNAVKNYGAGAAAPFTVRFYLSPDQSITTSDILIGSRSFSGLPAGAASSTVYTTCTVPASVPAGCYYVGWIIDPTNAVPETNEANNRWSSSTRTCFTGGGAPTIAGVSPNPVPRTGATITISGTNFAAGVQVRLTVGGVTISPVETRLSSTAIRVVVPSTWPAGAYTVCVQNPGMATWVCRSNAFTKTAPPLINTISYFSPNFATRGVGKWVDVYGTNFQPGAQVIVFYSHTSPVYQASGESFISSSHIRCYVLVPATQPAGWYNAEVQNPGQTAFIPKGQAIRFF